MKILFDVGHPAHVHYCRILARRLEEQGWSCLFTTKNKRMVIYLLDHYGLHYKSLGQHRKKPIGKIWSLLIYTIKLYFTAQKFKPDYFFNASPSAAFVSWVMHKVHISMEDTFNMEQVRLYLPFTDVVLTGNYPHPSLGRKEITYPGYHELAYLHPNTYTPDDRVLFKLGVVKGERYAIIRFVAWNASHDVGHTGLSIENKLKLVETLSSQMKVFITSEADLSDELCRYQIKIKPEDIHDALYFAHLFVGESGTMASEAAIMGTPAIFINNNHFGCIDDQANYGVLYQYPESESGQCELIRKAKEIASYQDVEIYKQRAVKLVEDKIDMATFLFWFICNYPSSKMKASQNHIPWEMFRSKV